MIIPRATCLRLLTHCMRTAFSFAADKTGNKTAARMAIMAITTNNSIKVNALFPHPEAAAFRFEFVFKAFNSFGIVQLVVISSLLQPSPLPE